MFSLKSAHNDTSHTKYVYELLDKHLAMKLIFTFQHTPALEHHERNLIPTNPTTIDRLIYDHAIISRNRTGALELCVAGG